MSRFSLSHLTDGVLLRDLAALVATDRATTAALLAHLAEVDARGLYRGASYESMYLYCIGEMKLSEDAAKKRIRATRTARRFPAIFAAVADGRLTLTAVLMLSRHLTRQNSRDLLGAVERRSNQEIEALLASRFPQPDVPTVLTPLIAVATSAPAARTNPATAWRAGTSASEGAARPLDPASDAPHPSDAPRTMAPSALLAAPTPPVRVRALAPQRFALQVTVSQATRDKLRRALDLLGHAVPSGDLTEVLDRALDALIEKLERRKFAATDRPRTAKACRSSGPRSIPANVRRAVLQRDCGQCTYVGSGGRRCESRKRLEFDHIVPVAHGGEATAANLRLRCRAHNQLEAEQAFGAEFMRGRREQARRAAVMDRVERTHDEPLTGPPSAAP